MSRILLSGMAILLLAALPSAQTAVPPDGLAGVAEYPPQDVDVWNLVRQGLVMSEAARASVDPGSVEAVRRYATADMPRMLDALRLIVDTYPQRMAAAFEAAAERLVSPVDDGETARQQAERVRDIVRTARRRLPDLSREDAARTARQLLRIEAELAISSVDPGADPGVPRDPRAEWAAALRRFVEAYQGTEAALLAEVDLISSDRVSRDMLDRLEAFAARHPGTTAAAKALYRQGFEWHTINTIGTIEPRGADPAPHLLRVMAIVEELESGRYPPSEWVDRAPSLVTGFFIPSDASIPRPSVDMMLAAFEGFVRTHFDIDAQFPTRSGIGYVITSKMADLFEMQGDRRGQVDRLLQDLERTGPDPAGSRYLRGAYRIDEARDSPGERERLLGEAHDILSALAAEGGDLARRRALATLAAMAFDREDWSAALTAYRRYTATYPASSWAWVAALRTGQCEERLGDPQAAAATYVAAAARFAALPVARVLGYEYAARAYEAAGSFAPALENRQRALDSWDNTYGLRYSTYVRHSPDPDDPFVPAADVAEVLKEALAPRIAQMRATLGQEGGEQLEQGRALLAGGRHLDADAALRRLIDRHPGSPLVPQARALAHRARLEHALQLADVARAGSSDSAALQELEALAREPVDFAVTAAGIARASLLWTRGDVAGAETIMRNALAGWQAQQRPSTPASPLEADVAAIRAAVFRPAGSSLYGSSWWNEFEWSSQRTPFLLVNADVRVTFADDDVTRVTLVQPYPGIENALFFDSEQLAVLKRIMMTLGGTRRRAPRQIMETPNQPIGDAVRILELWKRFFPAMPGHWGGWEIEAFPVITGLGFTDAARTKAVAHVTIGYSGGRVELEKEGTVWVARRLTNLWIT